MVTHIGFMMPRFAVRRESGYMSPTGARMLYGSSVGRPRSLPSHYEAYEVPAFVQIRGRWFQIPRWVVVSVFRMIDNYTTIHGERLRDARTAWCGREIVHSAHEWGASLEWCCKGRG